MSSLPEIFRKFFLCFIICFLLILWNRSFVEGAFDSIDGYSIDHMIVEKHERINPRNFDLKVICIDSLFAAILKKHPMSSSVKLTDDELDELLYSVLRSLNNYYTYDMLYYEDLSLKNFPEVMRLLFETVNPNPPNVQLLSGQYLNTGACRNLSALNEPMKGTWITSRRVVTFPEYSEIRPRTTSKMTTEVTTRNSLKVKDCRKDLILTKYITLENSRLSKNDWVTLKNKYRTDRELCLRKNATTKTNCLCSLNEKLKSRFQLVGKKPQLKVQ